MDKNELDLRAELIRVNRILAERGLIRSSDGNISVRLDRNFLLVTPTGVYKSAMNPEDLIVIDLDGKVSSARPGMHPTSETLMHLEAYRQRPDINAVIHAHPPFSTALTIAGKPFPVEYIPEVLIALGDVPTAAYATPGTQALADSIHDLILDHNCILLSHHGSLTVGASLEEALIAVERMEHAAYTLWISQAFGVPIPLPPADLAALRQIGDQLREKH
ncbi:MAG: class II aldolase/adducin family protein [Anaerolineales bacterium]